MTDDGCVFLACVMVTLTDVSVALNDLYDCAVSHCRHSGATWCQTFSLGWHHGTPSLGCGRVLKMIGRSDRGYLKEKSYGEVTWRSDGEVTGRNDR